MKVTEEALLASGFSLRELQKIKENIKNHGGDLEEVTQDLRDIFKAILVVFYICLASFILACVSTDQSDIVIMAISVLITMAIVAFAYPPVLAYKSWRYWKKRQATSDSAL